MNIYLIDGEPHRDCACDPMIERCALGRKRHSQTCGFGKCLIPAPDVVTTLLATDGKWKEWAEYACRRFKEETGKDLQAQDKS